MHTIRQERAPGPAAIRFAACSLLLAALVLAWPSPARSGESHAQQFEDWRFSLVTFKSGESFLVIRSRDVKSQDVELQMFKPLGNCDKTFMRIVLAFEQPTAKAVDNKNVSGEIRIDDAPLHRTASDISLPQGDKLGYVVVNSFENPGNVLTEMQNGQIVRFRFVVGERENFQRFSLRGFGQALETMRQACAQIEASSVAKRQSPSPKHKAKPQPKQKESDADFFAPRPLPPPQGGKNDREYFF